MNCDKLIYLRSALAKPTLLNLSTALVDLCSRPNRMHVLALDLHVDLATVEYGSSSTEAMRTVDTVGYVRTYTYVRYVR